MAGDGDLRRELQEWLISLPRSRLEEDAECRRLQESVAVLVGPSTRETRQKIRELLQRWGVSTTRATRTLPQQREVLWAHLLHVGRSLDRGPPSFGQAGPEGQRGEPAASAEQPRPEGQQGKPAAGSGSLASAAQLRPDTAARGAQLEGRTGGSRPLVQDQEALQEMSQWLASLPHELVQRRGVYQRMRASIDTLLKQSDRTTKTEIRRLLVAWGQGRGHQNERAAVARGRLCVHVLRIGR